MLSRNLRLRIMTIAGIPIKIDISWLVIFVLVTWTLAAGYFPAQFKGMPEYQAWFYSVLSAMLLFISILLHEISHSIVAKRTGLPIKEITLFIFGGVAQMTKEPDDPGQEFVIAIAGPAMSFVLVIFFTIVYFLSTYYYRYSPISAMFKYLAFINFGMIVFNMVPGLPLDGGRVLRAILWYFTGNLHKSTKISSSLGKGFGFLLSLLGVFMVLKGNLNSGIWFIIIGLFLVQAARMSYENVHIARFLQGVQVRDAMMPVSIAVPSNITLEELANAYFLRHSYKGYPVIRMGEVEGSPPISESLVISGINKGENDSRNVNGDIIVEVVLRRDFEGKRESSEDSGPEVNNMPTGDEVEKIETGDAPEISGGKIDDESIQDHIEEEEKENEFSSLLIGFVTYRDLISTPRNLWGKMTTADLVEIKSLQCKTVESGTPLTSALKKMGQERSSCLMVIDDGVINGVLRQQDIATLIMIRSSLAEEKQK